MIEDGYGSFTIEILLLSSQLGNTNDVPFILKRFVYIAESCAVKGV
ncbi:hypothetical protein [uncultured Clostridium sp.]|nr:hypothetical protein [uncultured Clostridium sp.]